jgi:hypothetical protein
VEDVGDATRSTSEFRRENRDLPLERVIAGLAVEVMSGRPAERAGDHL